jgi:arylsulfate sulfotransferase
MGRRLIPFLSGYLLLLFIIGCNSGSVNDGPTATITPATAVLLPGQTVQFNATSNGGVPQGTVWMVNNVAGGSAATGTISSSGLYTAPTTSLPASAQITLVSSAKKSQALAVAQVSFFQPNKFTPGTVQGSNNPLVATYNFTAPQGATVEVQFGTTTSYGLKTWAQPVPAGGGNVQVLVAGMRANTTYHMQAIAHLPTGVDVVDADNIFITSPISSDIVPIITVDQTAGSSLGSGVELLNLIQEAPTNKLTAVATDTQGNLIWYYPIQPAGPTPIKLLPNGHMLLVIDTVGQSEVREIDLAGNIIFDLTQAELQAGLKSINSPFQTLEDLHHDIQKLPNGHYMLLANYNKITSDQPNAPATLGDVLIEWDPVKGAPVWTWNTFDHIPLSHNPTGTSDWTHSNAIVYSPDDGNLILSMRDQNWIIKIDYQDGNGSGDILWHLGPGGDFTLANGEPPSEWNTGQHYPVFLSPNTAGIFSLMFFNNGNWRITDANNDLCGTTGQPACYSSVPVFLLNETTKTAQVQSERVLSPAFSQCCGSTNLLSNGDLEYDVAYDINTPGKSYIQEVTQGASPELIWQMNIFGELAYRGFRITSLYPGVEWTQDAIAAANATVKPATKAAKQ